MKRWQWWVFFGVLVYGLALAWIKLNLDHCAFIMPLFSGDACQGWDKAWRVVSLGFLLER